MAEIDIFDKIVGDANGSETRPVTSETPKVVATVAEESLGESAKKAIFAETAKDLGKNLLLQCIIPRCKQYLVAGTRELVDFTMTSIFGNVGVPSGTSTQTPAPRINYTGYSSLANKYAGYSNAPSTQAPPVKTAKVGSSIERLNFATLEDATTVLNDMNAWLDSGKDLSVHKYYEMCGVPELAHAVHYNYGWKRGSMYGVQPVPCADGKWALNLPDVVALR